MSYLAPRAHPGRNAGQRKALDRIGRGKPPGCSSKILKALLDAGFIVEAGSQTRRETPKADDVPIYEMSVLTHLQWRSAIAAADVAEVSFKDCPVEVT